MPYISVIMVTNRIGGIDIIFDSLRRQIFRDFEFILSDNLYPYRKDIIAEKAAQQNFKIIHAEPFANSFPLNAFCRSANTGLAHASGKIVLFLCDYTYLPEHSLFRHAQHHLFNPNIGYMAAHRYFQLQNIHPDFKGYTKEPEEKDNDLLYNHCNTDALAYAEDVRSGKYNHLMYSLFTEEFNFDTYKLEFDHLLAVADPKARLTESGFTNPNYFHGKNESVPLDSVLKIGGWGEYLDGSHAYQDSCIVDRLMKFGGIDSWYFDYDNGAYIINPRPRFPHGYRMRSVADNRLLWEQERDNNYPTKNSWSVKQINELNRMKYNIERQLKEVEIK